MGKMKYTGELLTSKELQDEYRRRRTEYDIRYIQKADPVPEGWQIEELKRKLKIYRPKPIDRLLQDKVWCLFYELGMTLMSDQDFSVELVESKKGKYSKQLDLVAANEEVLFVVECKSRKSLSEEADLSKDISDFAVNRSKITQILQRKIGCKLQTVFILATENIE